MATSRKKTAVAVPPPQFLSTKAGGLLLPESARSGPGIDFYTAQYLDSIDKTLDTLEQVHDLSAGHNFLPEHKNSFGLLMLDLITNGGMVPGGWFTFFGGEQSTKSTLVSTALAHGACSSVPLLGYSDFEGSVTRDTKFRVNGEDIVLPFPEELPAEKGFLDQYLTVETVGGQQVRARVHYGGLRTITQVTTAAGEVLKGDNHPMLVRLVTGQLAWKMIEEIEVGDRVIRCKTSS